MSQTFESFTRAFESSKAWNQLSKVVPKVKSIPDFKSSSLSHFLSKLDDTKATGKIFELPTNLM